MLSPQERKFAKVVVILNVYRQHAVDLTVGHIVSSVRVTRDCSHCFKEPAVPAGISSSTSSI